MCVFCYYFNFERNYDVLKLQSSCFLLNGNMNSNINKTELKMENPTHLDKIELDTTKENRVHFSLCLFCPKEIFKHVLSQCIVY